MIRKSSPQNNLPKGAIPDTSTGAKPGAIVFAGKNSEENARAYLVQLVQENGGPDDEKEAFEVYRYIHLHLTSETTVTRGNVFIAMTALQMI